MRARGSQDVSRMWVVGTVRAPICKLAGTPCAERSKSAVQRSFGGASYEVCSSCGFEFGFDDHPGAGEGVSFDEYRKHWVATGCVWWFTQHPPPPSWDGREQLRQAGLG